jgi:hypothetical protein
VIESQLKAISAFKSLPVYDESDERSAGITSAPPSDTYRGVRECWTLQEVLDGLKDPRLVPLGALRAGVDGGQVVVAYFGVQS